MKSFILPLFIFINGLYALPMDIVELYRTHGISAVEKAISKELQSKQYWDVNLKSKNITNGYYESIRYVMLCQKNLKDIKLYDTKNQQNIL